MVETQTVRITNRNANVTTFDNGGNSGTFEFIFDLQVPTGVKYTLRDGHELVLDLDDSGDSDLPDDAEVKFIGQDQIEEDETQIGDVETLRRFNNTDQYNREEAFRFDLEKPYHFTEDAHLKMKLDSSTAVSWSDSFAEIQLERRS